MGSGNEFHRTVMLLLAQRSFGAVLGLVSRADEEMQTLFKSYLEP